mmetsp:Transcript_25365/g.42480  ORF Transcript_25365/g.42480 Transcript_25365/m.42480 type:complete len:150 (+) Transcript_25365:72-521(+)
MPIHLSSDIDFASAVVGGLILGCSSTFYLLFSGKLTGISGLVENSISPSNSLDDKLSSWAYLSGLIIAGGIASFVDRDRLGIVSVVGYDVLVAGLLVGFGTRMGCGCTTGHGISGLPRFSLRSMVAVCSFMASGILSAYCSRQLKNQGV